MKKREKDMSLCILAIQSLLAMFVAFVTPFAARLQGITIDIISVFAYMFIGLVGMAAYQSILKMTERINELESQISEIKKQ